LVGACSWSHDHPISGTLLKNRGKGFRPPLGWSHIRLTADTSPLAVPRRFSDSAFDESSLYVVSGAAVSGYLDCNLSVSKQLNSQPDVKPLRDAQQAVQID